MIKSSIKNIYLCETDVDLYKEANMSNKIYPIGIQNFESLRNDNYFLRR